jgi:hypothetical protein
MEQPAGGGSSTDLEEARDCVGRAIELLVSEDIFGAVLQLNKARSILNDIPSISSKGVPHERHDWGRIDPYTAECRLCGMRRSLGIEERTLAPLNL